MATFAGGAPVRVDKTKLYMALGVGFNDDRSIIKSAYKKLALKHHPDRHSGASPNAKEMAERKFQEVAAAYEVLSDPVKRSAYDAHGMPGVEALERGHTGKQKAKEGGFGQNDGSTARSNTNANRGNSAGRYGISWEDSLAAAEYAKFQAAVEAESRRRAAAFATYASVFGSVNFASEVKSSSSSSSSSAAAAAAAAATSSSSNVPMAEYVVHNMMSQRGGGSFDQLQRKRLDEAFAEIDLKEKGKSKMTKQQDVNEVDGK